MDHSTQYKPIHLGGYYANVFNLKINQGIYGTVYSFWQFFEVWNKVCKYISELCEPLTFSVEFLISVLWWDFVVVICFFVLFSVQVLVMVNFMHQPN